MKRLGLLAVLVLGIVVPAWAQTQETPFQAETRLITQNLPCKWVSMGGRTGPSYGSGYFDFSCKGGTWGTITLLMNAQGFRENTLGSIRLGYRDWDPAVNPTAGEAVMAEQFLQYVLNRYVPANIAPQAREGFWQGAGSWKSGGTRVRSTYEEGNGFVQRWLAIERPQTQATALQYGTMPAVPRPWREAPDGQPTPPLAASTGLLKPMEASAPPSNLTPQFTPVSPQAPVQLPSPALMPQEGIRREAPLQVPTNAPAGPARGSAPQSFLESAAATIRGLTGLPSGSSPSAPLPPAADLTRLQTAPAPESQATPAPPPPVSASFVPAIETVINNRPTAPTNFSAYNEAEQLTKDLEARALAEARSLSPTTTAITSATLQVDPLSALAQPTAQPADPVATPPAAAQPDPRFAPTRGLPQLKFIPKAEPLDTSREVIRFEDEGQGL
jgi:hypothetical protein